MENDSNTPDFILADFLTMALVNFGTAIEMRDKWYRPAVEPVGASPDVEAENARHREAALAAVEGRAAPASIRAEWVQGGLVIGCDHGMPTAVNVNGEHFAPVTSEETERLREALVDQIRATAYAHLQRSDRVSLAEQNGTLIERFASPSAARALSASPGPQTGGRER